MEQQTLPVPVQDIKEKFPALMEKNLPLLEKWSKRADDALNEIPDKITSKEQAEEVNDILASVREVYEACYEKRTEISVILDAAKDKLMSFERPFNPDTKAKSRYNEKRKILEAWHQEEHDRVQKEKLEAAKKKEVENHKVDLWAKINENLHNMITNAVSNADINSKAYFDKCTLDDFDKKSETFRTVTPKLKVDLYDAAFDVSKIVNFNLIEKGTDYSDFISSVKEAEPFDKWNAIYNEKVFPVINEWRAKIPDLKAQLIAVAELEKKNKEEAEALKKQQKEEADRQAQERQAQLAEQAKIQQAKIQEEANLDKMSNEFAAQAVTQNIGDSGKTKLILKFADAKQAPKAFMEIFYHCVSNPDFQSSFPLFQKRDKSKKLMVDEKGRPVYIDSVQWFIDWFLNNCDAVVDGTVVSEDAKVTVRR